MTASALVSMPALLLLAAAAQLAVAAGCGTTSYGYEREMVQVNAHLARGDLSAARDAVKMELARGRLTPADAALLRLELSTVELRRSDFRAAAAALEEADPALEVYDLNADDSGTLSAALFNESATAYRTPVYEKLMVNVLGLAARLAAGDDTGAAVEARRLSVLERYYKDRGTDPGRILPVGHFLAGVAFRRTGRRSEAALFFRKARVALPQLFDGGGGPGLSAPVSEIVVVTLSGRAPRRVGRLAPVHAVARVARNPYAGRRLARLGVRDVVVVDLARPQPSRSVSVSVDGGPVFPSVVASLSATIEQAFAVAAPRLADASLSRAMTRAMTRSGIASLDGSGGYTGVLGQMLGQLAYDVMSDNDVPDTRCWSTLPAEVAVARVPVEAGVHEVYDGMRGSRQVIVSPGLPTVVLVVN